MSRNRHIQGAEKEYGVVPNYFFISSDNKPDMRIFDGSEMLFFSQAPIFSKYTRILQKNSVKALRDTWLQNMGRLYIDVGDHPEYSTPECETGRDVVIWQKAGDVMMARAVENINKKLWQAIESTGPVNGITENMQTWARKYIHEKCLLPSTQREWRHTRCLKPGSEIFRIYRNSIDTNHNTFGDHENHIVKRQVDFQAIQDVLLLHLISRIIWQGSGLIIYNPIAQKFEYRLSQREFCTGDDLVKGGTTEYPKPLIDIRDEPHAEGDKWRRLHIVGGDANMAEVATRLKYGTTMLLVLMIEDGFFQGKNLTRSNEELREAYRHFSKDLTFRSPCALLGGTYSALDIQWQLLGWAEEYFAGKEYGLLQEEISWQLTWWRKVLECAASDDPMHALFPYADDAAKYCLIESDMRKLRYSWADAPNRKLQISRTGASGKSTITSTTVDGRLKYWDIEYHRISNRFGMFQKLPMERVSTDSDIQYAIDFPPPNTRACARRKAADAFEAGYPKSRVIEINWTHVRGSLPGGGEGIYVMNDPFKSFLRLIYRHGVNS